jgi:hypothetical protein
MIVHWRQFAFGTTSVTVSLFQLNKVMAVPELRRFFPLHGVRLSPLGTVTTASPAVPAPVGRWLLWSNRWNTNWQGEPKYSEKTCSSATLSTKNPMWPKPGSNPGRRGGKPATKRLSYGTASSGGYMSASHRGSPFRFSVRSCGILADKMALGSIFSEFFGFPC